MKSFGKWLLLLLVLVGVGVICYFYFKPTPVVIQESYTLAEVALHSTKEDCWTAIEGNVYDITKFTGIHRGGEIILSACGTDATEKFNNRPGKGTAHSNIARKLLSEMKVGILKD